MAMPIGSFVGHKSPAMNFLPSASLVAGSVVVAEATVGSPGEVMAAASTTSVLSMVGVATDTVTYSATQTAVQSEITQVNVCRLIAGPFEVFRFKIAGGATTGTALATTAPANILTNTVASPTGVLVTGLVGSINMVGGLIKGRTGANLGVIRKMTVHTGTASTTVTIPFPNAIAVGETFIRVPFSRAIKNMQLTSDFVEANGIINTATGALFRFVSVYMDEVRDVAWADVIATGHNYNTNASA